MTPLLVYQIVVSVFVGFALVNAVADWRAFRRPRPAEPAGTGGAAAASWPSLSVLIPARNEAATLPACVGSLLAQDYRGPLELLLLTDADCVFLPGALAAAVRHREQVGADCLSLLPHLECRSFWEHVVVPLQIFLIFATLPVRNIAGSKNPAFAAANGAFLLLPRETYARLGGHEPVRGEMAEDIKFAQHVKRQGRRLAYGDGSRVYSVRMYDSLRGIWDGFSKNLFPAMGKSLPVLVVWSLFLWTTQVLPWAFVLAALVSGDRSAAGFWIPLAHVLAALAIRVALSVRFRQSVWAAATHPLGWLVTLAIGANSAFLALSGRGHAWKGRVYET
jgi:chlorobactene glucosyltransferase